MTLIRSLFSVSLTLLCLTALAQTPVDRPSALKLFPAETVALFRTADAWLLMERLRESPTAKMAEDPAIQPLISEFYGMAREQYDQYARDQVGIELDDLLRFPQGEVAIAVVGYKDRTPEFVFLVDYGEEAGLAEQLRDQLTEKAGEMDIVIETEQLTADEAMIIRRGNNTERMIGLVQRDTVFVGATDRDLLESVLARWDGREFIPMAAELVEEEAPAATAKVPEPLYARSLAENGAFVSVFKECVPGQEEPPQAMVFVDPINMIRSFNANNAGAKVAMLMLRPLGIDGLKGVGAAMWFSTDTWASLTRGHVLLENPRAGVLKIARLGTVETTPPAYVPADIENFFTFQVDPPRMFDEISQLVDEFTTEGNFRDLVERNLSTNMGVDFEQEFVNNVTGKLVWFTGYEDGTQRMVGGNLFVLELNDPAAFGAAITQVMEKAGERMEKQSYAGIDYYSPQISERRRERMRERGADAASGPPMPRWALVDDVFVQSDSEVLLQHFIDAKLGEGERLADQLQYRLVASRINRLTADRPPSVVMYNNPEQTWRHWYAMATGDRAREFLEGDFASRAPMLPRLREVVENDELPPIETILKYTAPGGAVLYDTETGFHFIGFGFKPPE
ncbi:hypothetical protein Pla175_33730 [Pirellulimonas nuda]|uniref:DUF3352 domain-containing protein n=1 Tax=Pirellulimonas nuda TaxID=2528009 RepID=A0A518DES2_9BACT|nr:hypothetical protein [Pirellulimonas nuda]QDU89974.1 hypothetical protein Pla175_33730 [Pirellulimonas nuda]